MRYGKYAGLSLRDNGTGRGSGRGVGVRFWRVQVPRKFIRNSSEMKTKSDNREPEDSTGRSVSRSREPRGRTVSLLSPSGLAKTFEYMGVVFGPPPWRSSTDVKVEGSRCNRDSFVECLPRLRASTKLAQGGSKSPIGQRVFGV
jgi:hypothetical protein